MLSIILFLCISWCHIQRGGGGNPIRNCCFLGTFLLQLYILAHSNTKPDSEDLPRTGLQLHLLGGWYQEPKGCSAALNLAASSPGARASAELQNGTRLGGEKSPLTSPFPCRDLGSRRGPQPAPRGPHQGQGRAGQSRCNPRPRRICSKVCGGSALGMGRQGQTHLWRTWPGGRARAGALGGGAAAATAAHPCAGAGAARSRRGLRGQPRRQRPMRSGESGAERV